MQIPTYKEREEDTNKILELRRSQLIIIQGFLEGTLEIKGDRLISELIVEIKNKLKEKN
jgi:hypothetical protein